MSEIKEYKCPACGGAMEFDSKSQKMKCPYCDTETSVDEYESLIAKADQVVAADAASDVETEQKKAENYTAHDWNQDEIDNMVVYICQSCGGEITADKNTGATTCPFCGNRVVLKGQFEGALKPDYVIPFKLDKKAAKVYMFRSGYSISNQKLIYPMTQKKSVSGSPGIPNIQSTNIIKSAGEAQSILNMCRKTVL